TTGISTLSASTPHLSPGDTTPPAAPGVTIRSGSAAGSGVGRETCAPSPIVAPQCPQKRAPDSFSLPHWGQNMVTSLRTLACTQYRQGRRTPAAQPGAPLRAILAPVPCPGWLQLPHCAASQRPSVSTSRSPRDERMDTRVVKCSGLAIRALKLPVASGPVQRSVPVTVSPVFTTSVSVQLP